MTAVSRTAKEDPWEVLASFGQLREPADCDEPILNRDTRGLVTTMLQEARFAAPLEAVGLKPRRRVMLGGPPGTGKTTLAWHLSARLGIKLLVVESSSLLACWVNKSGENLGKLFAAAREVQDVALFFDELDAVATTRNETSSQENSKVVIALLQMLDRHEGLVFAATNRPDMIDAAVWRRFEMQIEIGLPGNVETFAIIRRYLAPFYLDDSDVSALTTQLQGASPALLRRVMEAIKRDLVLGERLKIPLDVVSVFNRILLSQSPPPDQTQPKLWCEPALALQALATMAWPPERRAA